MPHIAVASGMAGFLLLVVMKICLLSILYLNRNLGILYALVS